MWAAASTFAYLFVGVSEAHRRDLLASTLRGDARFQADCVQALAKDAMPAWQRYLRKVADMHAEARAASSPDVAKIVYDTHVAALAAEYGPKWYAPTEAGVLAPKFGGHVLPFARTVQEVEDMKPPARVAHSPVQHALLSVGAVLAWPVPVARDVMRRVFSPPTHFSDPSPVAVAAFDVLSRDQRLRRFAESRGHTYKSLEDMFEPGPKACQ
jgi:hypothetical protein